MPYLFAMFCEGVVLITNSLLRMEHLCLSQGLCHSSCANRDRMIETLITFLNYYLIRRLGEHELPYLFVRQILSLLLK